MLRLFLYVIVHTGYFSTDTDKKNCYFFEKRCIVKNGYKKNWRRYHGTF